MQGVFVDGNRPTSKKQVKEAIADDPRRVRIEATSLVSEEYDGPASDLPATTRKIAFVGPDPYSKRNFYGTIEFGANSKLKVT